MSLIHGYTSGFWVGAAIFGAGAVMCGTLFRSGPLRTAAAVAPTGAASGLTVASARAAVPHASEAPSMHV
jgi:hypothetical protein